jgi:hypothetical protein
MIVKPRNKRRGQYINKVEVERFDSVWISHGGLMIHVYAGLEGMEVDVFAEPLRPDADPIDTAFAPWPAKQ